MPCSLLSDEKRHSNKVIANHLYPTYKQHFDIGVLSKTASKSYEREVWSMEEGGREGRKGGMMGRRKGMRGREKEAGNGEGGTKEQNGWDGRKRVVVSRREGGRKRRWNEEVLGNGDEPGNENRFAFLHALILYHGAKQLFHSKGESQGKRGQRVYLPSLLVQLPGVICVCMCVCV